MDTQPRVSIITPFLAPGALLEEAVESVLEQTFPSWELLLIDDGADSASRQIAIAFATKYPAQIRYLSHPANQNEGVAVSRNLGLAHARGALIAYLDADDVWFPKKLEQQVAIMDRFPEAGMVYGRSQVWHSWDPEAEKKDRYYELGVNPDSLIPPPQLLLTLIENKSQYPDMCNAMVRKEVSDKIGGFDASFRLFEDAFYFAKIELTEHVYVSGEVWARYRQHGQGTWRQASAAVISRARHDYLLSLAKYIAEAGIHHSNVDSTLRNELFSLEHPTLAQIATRLSRLGQKLRTAARTLTSTRRYLLTQKKHRTLSGEHSR